jgi:hypothetical protein
MIQPNNVLSSIPDGLRKPLIGEYNSIIRHYLERHWTPSELSGGKFCEIIYTILDGYASGTYAAKPSKPSNFVDACRRLESNTSVPRSFQILIPRMLPALYEIRNNRNVGHVGGDVDPNYMDSMSVVSMTSWIMAELVRVFHSLDTQNAQKVVDSLVEYKVPLVWQSDEIKRVLNPNMILKEQILVLLLASSNNATTEDLIKWTEAKNIKHFNAIIKKLHQDRLIELNTKYKKIQILPPGSSYIREKIEKLIF